MRRLLAGAVAVLALWLTGCVQIQSDTASQQQAIGDVVVTTTVCPSPENHDHADCDPSNTNGHEPANAGELLVAYRVPVAVTAPSQITISRGSASRTLNPEAVYGQQLTNLVPPGPGMKWVGYISTPIDTTEVDAGTPFNVSARFALNRGSDGAPFPSNIFPWRTVVGYRTHTADAASQTRPVNCGPSATTVFVDQDRDPGSTNDARTECIDSPLAANLSTNNGQAIRDVGVLNGQTVNAEPGQAVSVPFQIKSIGASLPIMNLSAGTTAPAATATSSLAQIQPNASTQSVPVSVDVGPNTPPGTYDVTLTATTVSGQQLRVGTWKVTVAPPPTPEQPQQPQQPQQPAVDTKPPVGSLAFAGKVPKLKTALKKGLKFTVTCDEACSAIVTLKKGSTTLGTGKGSKPAPGGTFSVTVKFSKKVQKKYARTKKLKLSALLAVKDGAGLSSSATKTLTLKR